MLYSRMLPHPIAILRFTEIQVDKSSRENQQKSVIKNTFDVCIKFFCKGAVKKAPFLKNCGQEAGKIFCQKCCL